MCSSDIVKSTRVWVLRASYLDQQYMRVHSRGMTEFICVAKADDIEDHRYVPATVNGTRVLVFNLGGEYFAIEDRCSHAASSLNGGRCRNGRIFCPLHGAQFDIRTGQPRSPPASAPVRTFLVNVSDGCVRIAVGPEPHQ
jgi:3-phenylpropionate/trans-cinnamate dioxygenase ferredoxin component